MNDPELQRGRRCSRRRGPEGEPKAPPTKGASTRPALFTPERGRKSATSSLRTRRFNEAGVVHAGEDDVVGRARARLTASTRPALFTPERQQAALIAGGVAVLQRGRRCSRRRGPHLRHGGLMASPLQRGRRCSRRRGAPVPRSRIRGRGFNEAGVVHAGEDGEASSRPRRCRCFNEAGVVHAGEGNA